MSGKEHLNRADALVEEFGDEYPEYQQELRLAIESGDLLRGDEARARFQLGASYNVTWNNEAAIPVLEGAFGLIDSPEFDAMLHHELGDARRYTEDEGTAERHYRASLAASRDHPKAPDSMLFLARCVVDRGERTNDPQLLREGHELAVEAEAIYESPLADNFQSYTSRGGVLFDAKLWAARSLMGIGGSQEQQEAAERFAATEEHLKENRDDVPNEIVDLMFGSWVRLLQQMGEDGKAEFVRERWQRATGG